MRPFRAIVCLVYCLSFVLTPVGMLHAHVAADQHAHSHVHGGPNHELAGADGDTHEHEGHVVELKTAPDHSPSTPWWSWLAMPLVLVMIGLCSACLSLVSRERRRDVRVPKQFPPWPPPLRGPPLSI